MNSMDLAGFINLLTLALNKAIRMAYNEGLRVDASVEGSYRLGDPHSMPRIKIDVSQPLSCEETEES